MTYGKIKPSVLAMQTIAAMTIAYQITLSGFVYAWPSYTVLNFMSNDTMLSAPMTPLQNNLFGSLTNVGALIATPFCGYAVNTLGRKHAAVLFGLPYVICWSIIFLTNDARLVLLAMGIGGVGAAGQAVSSVYISEIAMDSIRGGLASTTVSGYFIGLLTSYILGGYLSYHQVLCAHLTLSVLYMFVLMMLKESPVFLMQKGREKEAARSLAFYRRLSVTSKEVQYEISRLKMQIDPKIDKIILRITEPDVAKTLLNTKHQTQEVEQPTSSWRFLMKSESSKRALFAVLCTMTLTISMGSIVLQVYAEPLMKEAAPSVPSNLAAILLAVDFLVASAICSVIVDRLGRKALMTYSSLGAGGCALLLGIQLKLHFAPHWVTVLIIYLYGFVFTIGASTVPYILTAEVFLPEVRGLCCSISMGCMWIMNFMTLSLFNLIADFVGLGPVFIGFAGVCLLGAIYSQVCLPETRGLSVDEIQLLFLKKKKTDSKA